MSVPVCCSARLSPCGRGDVFAGRPTEELLLQDIRHYKYLEGESIIDGVDNAKEFGETLVRRGASKDGTV